MRFVRVFQILLISSLVLAAFGSPEAMQAPAARAHPMLLSLAEDTPDQWVRVIVQKQAGVQGVEALAATLGGSLTADLSIINAFAAEMRAESAMLLSQEAGVRWVSLDAPVVQSGKPTNTETYTVRDDFEVVSFYNNDGTAGWKTSWMEVDPAGAGPEVGNIIIPGLEQDYGEQSLSGELFLHNHSHNVTSSSITRAIDLSEGVVSAWISYRFRIGPEAQQGEDTIDFLISNDGGESYQTLYTLSFNGGTTGTYYRDVLPFASPDTRIRFEVASGFNQPNSYFTLDYLQIEYEGSAFPSNTFLDTLRVRDVWNMGIDGSGVGVAIIDSGITKEKELGQSVKVQNSFSAASTTVLDLYGHGTHLAGIIAMQGFESDGSYYGISPGVDLYSLKVNDSTGFAYESDVVAAMQWVYDNKGRYNIRVVNLSLNTTTPVSYHQSPMDAAAEILWFNNVVVVVSAGNYFSDLDFNPVLAAPANDPFVITVGATDEKGTSRSKDDVITNFSAFGTTQDGYFKPDIYAPGRNIVSLLSDHSDWDVTAPERVVGGKYFRLSGTSMSAPMVSGAVALLLQDEPELTPDQVKYRLIETGNWIGPSKYLDIYAAVTGDTLESANTGLLPSLLLATGEEAIAFDSVGWNSVGWNSVGWNSVGWNSVGWNSVGWNSVGWNSTFWGE